MTLMESFVRCEIVRDLLSDYKVKVEKRVIPTGIELAKFERPEIGPEQISDLRDKLGIKKREKMTSKSSSCFVREEYSSSS